MSNNKQSSSIDWILDWIEDVDLTPELWEKIKKQGKEKYEHEMCVFADEYASYVLEQSKSGIKGAMVSMCAWTFFKNRRNEQQ